MPVDVKQVLIVDDDSEIRELLTTVLRSRGFHVEAVGDGAAMRGALAKMNFHLVVLDALLRLENGQTLADHVRQLDIPVLMISGDPSQLMAMSERHVEVMSKPLRVSSFVERVRTMTESVGQA
ncbi:MAG TPA: response regulator [Stellaceae bacterium]|nr:response regulator [Stellaceae bacterium]